MTTHTLTLIEGGRWKIDISTGDNSLNWGERYKQQRELFVEAECSCGKTFNNEDKAMEHITKHQKERGQK